MWPNGAELLIVLVLVAVVAGVGLYIAFAPGPRRWRVYSRAQKLLEADDWKGALALVATLQPEQLTGTWKARLRNLAGECHQRAMDHALKEQDFEAALGHASESAGLLDLDATEQRARVTEAALAEVRRLVAAGTSEADTAAVRRAIERATRLAGEPTPEGLFWSALLEVRDGNYEQAVQTLQGVYDRVGKQVLDPAFYLGVLLHRLGRPQEALRYLADANRLDGNCPFVTWQMGVSIVACQGDSGLAMRALQRALGNRGLGMWQQQPHRAWVEGFPEARSYVRRLANKHRYLCPLLGGDLNIILRQGNLALAQAFYRLERFQEAADLYGKLLQDSPPTVMLLRGYGLSLARLGQYDQAFKHLRIALEQEEPKDAFTAGYLALCGALGKPTNPDDKPKNVTWALRLLARYPVIGNVEWAGLISAVQAEARKTGVSLDVDDQLLLCDTLASVQATDPRSALAYSHLESTFPEAVKPVHAWLYARAAVEHGVSSPADLGLFARVFLDSGAARAFFAQQKWDFAEVEYTYLERCAQQVPGRFPEVLGADYPAQGEAFLLARSRQEEQAGNKEPARACVEVLLRLAPSSLAGHDRLACLHYRAGDMDRAIELLEGWQQLAPGDHWPVVRRAVIEQERGNARRRGEEVERALRLTRGALRGAVAYLGARLALRETARAWKGQAREAPLELDEPCRAALDEARQLLEECLREAPEHSEALWCLAAVNAVRNDRDSLAGQAEAMDRPEVADARFHYAAAACQLAAQQYDQALASAQRASADATLEADGRFLMALAQLQRGEETVAREMLRQVAASERSSSAVYARALLGRLAFARGASDEAIAWWSSVAPAYRARWDLEEPLRQTTLLAGLAHLEARRYEQAAERFREAGKLGLRERRLGGLITLALVKAGQRLLYETDGA